MNDISTPTLLLDEEKAEKNLKKMVAKAKHNGLHFRPHFKTHQSKAIGEMVRTAGIRACTVSSIRMAAYFAAAGWEDITVAFPANLRESASINALADKLKLNLIVEDAAVVSKLDELLDQAVGLFIKTDAGYHRTGVAADDYHKISAIITAIDDSKHAFRGFLIHDGHTYQARGAAEVVAIHQQTHAHLGQLRERHLKNHPEAIISLGDTPTFSILDDFSGFEEMRPGNFIFYDVAQWQIGSCDPSEIAVCMACPVVAKHPERLEIVVYGGSVHFSKDRISWEGKEVFGFPVALNDNGWGKPDFLSFVKSLSQEHGIVKLSQQVFDQYHVGDLMGILPIHSCLTADCMGGYRNLRGEYISMFAKK